MTRKRHIFLGRIADISCHAHLSWLLFLPLGTMVAIEPLAAETDWPPLLRWLLALTVSLLAALSNGLHELGHLATAVIYRLPVRRVVLYPFGGLLHMGSAPVPSTPFVKVTLAGPLVSLLLAGGLFGSWWLWGHVILLWLAQYNLLLALLNLLPAPPLDGSRLLWLLQGRFHLPHGAAAVSFLASLIVLLTLLAPGAVAVLSGLIWASPAYIIGGGLLLLTGCLIHTAPVQPTLVLTAQYRQLLQQTPVSRLLAQPVTAVTPRSQNRLTGAAFLAKDIRGPQQRRNGRSLPTLEPWTVTPAASLLHALHKLDAARASRLLVVVNGRVIDTLTRAQILNPLRQPFNLPAFETDTCILLTPSAARQTSADVKNWN